MSISGDRGGKPICVKGKPVFFQNQPQRSHTVTLIPERLQVLCNANTLHELKKVLAIQGRFLNRIHSFPVPIPQRSCVVNESLVALPSLYRLSKAFTTLNNEQPYPTNVLAKSIETLSQPLPSARVPKHITPKAKLPRFHSTQRQLQKNFPDIDIDRHQQCQCISSNKPSISSLQLPQKLLNSFCKDNIHKHIQYLRNCHIQAEIVKKRFESKQTLNLANSNDHFPHSFAACFCVENLHSLDRNQRNSVNNFSISVLSEEKQEKLSSLLDSLYCLRLDSADSKLIQIPKIVLTDYSVRTSAVELSEVKWKLKHLLNEGGECTTSIHKSVNLDSKDTMLCKYVLREDRITNNIF
ncbi:uncharacterized protein LOC118468871 isoform X1 [Anopheles albimanus]|uniref:uncharacterized protein LOC118468871 isoform X1 n=1 Tax=Anopheles albimanus TaxID=7167 RepID=UPI001641DBAE|nr:uncharacterized protein LOC118468871 isoform X1 [Anopheles albimanus]